MSSYSDSASVWKNPGLSQPGAANGIQSLEDSDTAKHSTMHKKCYTKNYLVQNVNSVKLKESCSISAAGDVSPVRRKLMLRYMSPRFHVSTAEAQELMSSSAAFPNKLAENSYEMRWM